MQPVHSPQRPTHAYIPHSLPLETHIQKDGENSREWELHYWKQQAKSMMRATAQVTSDLSECTNLNHLKLMHSVPHPHMNTCCPWSTTLIHVKLCRLSNRDFSKWHAIIYPALNNSPHRDSAAQPNGVCTNLCQLHLILFCFTPTHEHLLSVELTVPTVKSRFFKMAC